MMTAVDTNVIMDVLIPGEPFAGSSKKLLDRHLSSGKLVICEVVFSELASFFLVEEDLTQFLADTGIGLLHSNAKALYMAGVRWAEFSRKAARSRHRCARCGHSFAVNCPECGASVTRRLHVLGDFIIGAHALVQADCLLSRDLGVYRTYFKDLELAVPREERS